MLQDALDAWLWLLFPAGSALVGFALFAAVKAWSRRSKDLETAGLAASLPAKVRNVRKIEVQLPS